MSTKQPDTSARQDRPPATVARRLRPAEIGTLVFIFTQLLLCILVLREIDMLPLALRRVVYLATAGFAFQLVLPLRFRLQFFVALSGVALLLVLGTPTSPNRYWEPTAALIRAGLVLFVGAVAMGVCHLPLAFWTRAGLLVGIGTAVAALRAGVLDSGGQALVWPILAGMFMFRLVIYMYELSTSSKRPSFWHRAAYFFMLPNVGLTFFPVIDFKTMSASFYSDAPLRTYQKGVHWITRGVIHLLIYRYVDQVFSNQASNVDSGVDLVRFLLMNSLLYLNVSGSFHLITGVLLLFGFNLPETNHHYFLASSFTDYWRRVNIYWKDFMMKTSYYPAYFRLKRLGATAALVGATLWVFVLTWALHLYQTWWLTGSASITLPDVLFWSILGVLVLVNSVWEMKRGRRRTVSSAMQSTGQLLGLAVRTAATFACVSVLWSLWSSPSLPVWLGLWAHADWTAALIGAVVLGMIGLCKIVVEVVSASMKADAAADGTAVFPLLRRGLLQCVVPLALIYAVAQPAVQAFIPVPALERYHPRLSAQRLFDTLQAGDSFPPRRDGGELNYYRRFARINEGNRQLMEVMFGQRIPAQVEGVFPVTQTKDFRLWELTPGFSGAAFETDVRTNAFGMRDRDYEQRKGSNTVRIALLGSSHVMGWGVRHPDVFEAIVEERLNRRPPVGFEQAHFEVLNFAVYGYSPLSQVSMLNERVRAFDPDVVLLVGHLPDGRFTSSSLRSVLQQEGDIRYDFLTQTLREARVYPGLHDGLAEQRLRPFEATLVEWSLRQVAHGSRSMCAVPIFAYFTTPAELPLDRASRAEASALMARAAEAGFTVADLSGVFDGHAPADLLAGISAHSNAKAHALIADKLYSYLTEVFHMSPRTRGPGPSGRCTPHTSHDQQEYR
jgi:hypothetical protein